MPEFKLTADIIAGLTGVVISLLFSYFPVLKEQFAGKSTEFKSGVMLVLMALVTGAITALNYFGVLNAGISFVPGWPWQVVWVFVSAVIGNQAAFKISPQTPSVKLAKALRDCELTEIDPCAEIGEPGEGVPPEFINAVRDSRP